MPGTWPAVGAGIAQFYDGSNNGKTNALLSTLRTKHKLDERVTGLPEDMFESAQEVLEDSLRQVCQQQQKLAAWTIFLFVLHHCHLASFDYLIHAG